MEHLSASLRKLPFGAVTPLAVRFEIEIMNCLFARVDATIATA
jgi:hypothetical protein